MKEILKEYYGEKVFLIDFLWYCHKCFYVHQDFETSTGIKNGHLYGLANLVQRILTHYPNSLIIMCEDCGSKDRKELNEDYKANRKEKPFEDIWDYAHDLFSSFSNIQFAYHKGYEADDMMFSISRIKDYNNEFIIVSGDNDLMQALDESTTIVKSITNKGFQNVVTPDSEYYIKRFKDIPPSKIPYYRAIIGDKSDNLKPIMSRFPKKLAYYYTMNYPNLDLEQFNSKELTFLSEIMTSEIFKTNLKIMQLKPIEIFLRKKYNKTIETINKLELNAFKRWYTSYSGKPKNRNINYKLKGSDN